jgi:hypothetical protein
MIISFIILILIILLIMGGIKINVFLYKHGGLHGMQQDANESHSLGSTT